ADSAQGVRRRDRVRPRPHRHQPAPRAKRFADDPWGRLRIGAVLGAPGHALRDRSAVPDAAQRGQQSGGHRKGQLVSAADGGGAAMTARSLRAAAASAVVTGLAVAMAWAATIVGANGTFKTTVTH